MSRTVTSPIARFPGTVTLRDPITFPALIAWKDAWEEALKWATRSETPGKVDVSDIYRFRSALIPGIAACIESHALVNAKPGAENGNRPALPASLSLDNFPASPELDALQLIAWLTDEVQKVINEVEDDPKDSRSEA